MNKNHNTIPARPSLSVRTHLHAGFVWKDCDDMLTYCQGNICGMLYDKPREFSKCTMGVCKPAYDECRKNKQP